MAVLTTISRIPLFTTVQEALAWAEANGQSGYHTHRYKRQIGYMGGTHHPDARPRRTQQINRTTTPRVATPRPTPIVVPTPQPVIIPQARRTTTPVVQRQPEQIRTPRITRTSGGSGGGGGGY